MSVGFIKKYIFYECIYIYIYVCVSVCVCVGCMCVCVCVCVCVYFNDAVGNQGSELS